MQSKFVLQQKSKNATLIEVIDSVFVFAFCVFNSLCPNHSFLPPVLARTEITMTMIIIATTPPSANHNYTTQHVSEQIAKAFFVLLSYFATTSCVSTLSLGF
jgi:hypothetical protein